ncbi:MAG TPA: tetratricopeptide repeat protein [Chthoniobacterales bacterium]|nr:tetratricopeptide repeat protein [Chthoniobacterales bacterium]
MNFFSELKRRNVYKVAVAYAVVAWLLIQASSILFPTFEAPPWVMKVVVVVVVIGFPIALIIAWAFELTPEGLKRTESAAEAPGRTSGGRVWIYVVIAGVLLSAGLFFLGRYTARTTSKEEDGRRSAVSLPAKSIAVLPFASLSEDKANAYFADGIQDEILTRLSKIAELKVISRTSTQQYQSKPGNLAEIAKHLGVAHILEGSVQKSGDSVRVNVQLIKAEGDSHLWAETYDRKLTDIFAVETEVAQRIADSLAAKLTGHEKEAINYVGTKIPAAYDAYLRGIALRNSQSPQDQERLIQYCRQAVALDPNFAAAWVDLAFAEGLKYSSGYRTEPQRLLVKEAAENALRLDPGHGDGHAAMGMYLYYCLRDYDQALVELEKAREQAPNQPLTIQAIGLVKRRQGKLEESIALLLEASQLDPLNQDMWMNLAWSYRGMRRFGDAHAMLDRAYAIAPNDQVIVARKVNTCLAQGDLATASRLLEPLTLRITDDAYESAVTLLVFQRRFDEAIAKITADLAREESMSPLLTAFVHTTLGALHIVAGKKDQAEPFLSKAEAELLALRQQGNTSAEVSATLLEIHALLGRRAEVEREVPELIASLAKDRWRGPSAEADAARAYSSLGARDRALPILERLLVQPYADSLTPALLRLDPVWDPIRDDPRFQKLMASEKKP